MPSLLDRSNNPCTKASPSVFPSIPWAQQSLGLPRAQELTSGAGVTVAVIDTGVSQDAPALKGRVTAVDAAGEDCVGHGTFIAGVIAAAPTADTGVSGVAPESRILAITGLDRDGNPNEARVAAGIRAATDHGATVIDVSLTFSARTPAMVSALAYAAQHDVLVVAPGLPDEFAAPRGATDEAPPHIRVWPAAWSGVLSVVDVDVTGARPDVGAEPARADLSAPGQGIAGIGPEGHGHFLGNGPSIAAAFTAGAAALLRAYEPSLTASQVAVRLKSSAYPAPQPRLDPYGALAAVLPDELPASVGASAAIELHPEVKDRHSVHRAFKLLGGAATAALILTATGLLRRRKQAASA
ncbi:S8 family serine peptidase [Streptomyces sp. NPDC051664]|uniref:S8 family serine peptidase n=1 Tax=Streptomyces sp. NPDC051664 TaxID=3365668 RepID=UPI0037AB2C7D